MALRSPSSTPRLDLASRDALPADSPPPASQCRGAVEERRWLLKWMGRQRRRRQQDTLVLADEGGSRNGARVDVARKTKEVEDMLANLEKEGVEIDTKIASIIDDEVAIIKAEAARENINEPKSVGLMVLDTIACIALGFLMGANWYEHAFNATVDRIFFGK